MKSEIVHERKENLNMIFVNLKIKRWGWSWLYLKNTSPSKWYYIPQWIVGWIYITVKGLVGGIGAQ
jgi:hypothetical protein